MPTVYVVHQAVDNKGRGIMDLSAAEAYGRLVKLAPAILPLDIKSLLPAFRKLLSSYQECDYILPIGHPILIGWATVFAAGYTCGKVQHLMWDGKTKTYNPVSVTITLERNHDLANS